MPGPLKMLMGALAVAGTAAGVSACGGSSAVKVASNSPYHHGAELFSQHCSGCHTLDVAGAQGSATKVRDRERTDGPNFNVRAEQASQVLYAIRNGGFSGAIMPQNIVVSSDAEAIAGFLARYSGRKAKTPKGPAEIGQGSSAVSPAGP